MNTGKTVFITGAGGFIGANLTRKLLSLGYDVHIVSKPTSNLWRLKDIEKDIKIHGADILEEEKLKETLSKIRPDFIFHLAAYGSYSIQRDAEKIIGTNINGTLNLLNASWGINYKSLVITGTSSEYGFKQKPMKETDVLEPISFYAASKASATLLSQVFAREHKKPVSIVRPFSVYGQYEEPTRFIPTVINALINGTDINLTPGDQRRDFVYIDDVINAYLSFLETNKNLTGEIFNIGTGIQYSNDEVVETLFKITGKKVNIKKGAFEKRMWDTSNWVADISKIKRELGWQPKFTLEKGLKKFYNFLNNAKN